MKNGGKMRTIIGVCLGVAKRNIARSGKSYEVTEVGISEDLNDAFKSTRTTRLRIGQKQMSEGLEGRFEKVKGKVVQIVYYTANRNGVQAMYALSLLDLDRKEI